ncbi:UDP-2,4-diacetamido-2,4,6-trideoxy-beta-L-altropyranose hydrolase [Modicisalibacter xianhensis]|uniref:UDP-2,4-diacetamido-2,4, 6-trideoxy-beta-L-altropyranose hydrolase n=2 Tax=Modicisalibacter xianhensis TaxID=442341 RepID=A0A4R8G6C5_9GAMM|nr:UDP-2,4-diacetamido-2,4,6-trideoxy-beta-L-altropyranose hydrolase [Halomonas xianhensis]
MRCLTLADELSRRGGVCHFLCRAHQGHLMDAIQARGYQMHRLPKAASAELCPDRQAPAHAAWLGTDWVSDSHHSREVLEGLAPSWLVVDHYALDVRWERHAVPEGVKLLAIDDLADRPHHADVLLDQNLGRDPADYAGLVPAHCQVLAGPRYALLRPEFAQWRAASLARRATPALGRVLVTMGGVDKDNVTGRIMTMLKECNLPDGCTISVVMGTNAPWLEAVRELAETMPWPTEVAVGVQDMARRMAQADLAIGAAGSTSWERCCLGLPTLMVVLADNQFGIARALHRQGAALTLGHSQTLAEFRHALSHCMNQEALRNMSQRAATVVDGAGVERLCKTMFRGSRP